MEDDRPVVSFWAGRYFVNAAIRDGSVRSSRWTSLSVKGMTKIFLRLAACCRCIFS